MFDGEVKRITLNTQGGEISVLEHHEPMITLIEPGHVFLETTDGEKSFAFPQGIFEIKSNGEAVLLAKHI